MIVDDIESGIFFQIRTVFFIEQIFQLTYSQIELRINYKISHLYSIYSYRQSLLSLSSLINEILTILYSTENRKITVEERDNIRQRVFFYWIEYFMESLLFIQ